MSHLRLVETANVAAMVAPTGGGEIISIPRTVKLLRHGQIDYTVHDDSLAYLRPLADQITIDDHPLFYAVSLLTEYDYDEADGRHFVVDELGQPMADWTIAGSGRELTTYLTVYVTSYVREVPKLAQVIQFPGRS